MLFIVFIVIIVMVIIIIIISSSQGFTMYSDWPDVFYVDQTGSNSWRSACCCLSGAGIKACSTMHGRKHSYVFFHWSWLRASG